VTDTEPGRGPAPPWTRLGQQDLTEWYTAVLAGPRVRYLEELNVWAVFRYDDVEAVLRNDLDWSTGRRLENMPEELRPYTLVSDTVVGSDPPDHTRLRRLVTPAFRPGLIKDLRERAQSISRELLDAALPKGSFDFVGEYARLLPSKMIAEMLGLPEERQPAFFDLMSSIEKATEEQAQSSSDDEGGASFVGSAPADKSVEDLVQRGLEQERRWRSLIDPEFESRRDNPKNDMLTSLIQAEEEGGRLSKRELEKMALLLNFAGSTTTQTLLSNTVVELARRPDQWRKLRERPELIRSTIEEMLRFRAPLHAISRIANSDMELHGVKIPKDGMLLTFLQAANRDPAVFQNPHEVDIERANPHKHLSFATGIHFCLGSHLARMETEVMLADWIGAVDSWEVGSELDFPGRSISVISLSTLPISVTRCETRSTAVGAAG
jgi:cytochrome P450